MEGSFIETRLFHKTFEGLIGCIVPSGMFGFDVVELFLAGVEPVFVFAPENVISHRFKFFGGGWPFDEFRG